VRPTRLIYVENDPALRGILARLLRKHPEVDVVLDTNDPKDALRSALVESVDVALLDLALGNDELNGIDLGLAMRRLNDNIGIVIYSQYRLDTVARTVPQEALIGWSTIQKSGEMDVDELVEVIRATAAGLSHGIRPAGAHASPLEALSMRQRAVMGLTASGIKAGEIGRRLAVSAETVRQDLSKAYRVLVPDAGSDVDLRTKAILVYQDLIRDDDRVDGG
jgi:DNA-binding NarL/FixJ family response regulator